MNAVRNLKLIVGIFFGLVVCLAPAANPTAVAERIQRGERIDVLALYNEVAADAEEAIDAGSR